MRRAEPQDADDLLALREAAARWLEERAIRQ